MASSDRETGGSFDEPRGGTEPINPIPERSFAPVFPYRGTQQHGVPVDPVPWIPRDADAQSWEGETVFDPEIVPIEPIPVIVVNETQSEIRSWRAVQMPVRTNAATLIVGQNTRMTRVRIRNMSASDSDTILWVGHESNVSRLYGWPVYPGEVLEIDTEEEIYGTLDSTAQDADTVDIAILVEHRVA